MATSFFTGTQTVSPAGSTGVVLEWWNTSVLTDKTDHTPTTVFYNILQTTAAGVFVSTSPPVVTSSTLSGSPKNTTFTAQQSSPSSITSSTTSGAPTVTIIGKSGKSKGVSSGEAAGIAIGAAIALAFLTFLVTFLVMRRRQRSGQPHHSENQNGYIAAGSTRSPNNEKSPVVTERGPTSAQTQNGVSTQIRGLESQTRALDSQLPPSADDRTVQHNISTLFEQISLHVENFYTKSAIPVPSQAESQLAAFESPYLPSPLGSLFSQARNGIPMIKHCLCRLIISSIAPTGDPRTTFLPPEFVGLPSILENARSKQPKKPVHDEALSRWRVLTSYLLPPPSTSSTYLATRDAAIATAVHSFTLAFRPWINPRHSDSDRVRNLTEIMKSAAEQGIWLFGQPSGFKFQWGDPEEVGAGSVVTSPALWKISDERGGSLERVQVVVERAVGRI